MNALLDITHLKNLGKDHVVIITKRNVYMKPLFAAKVTGETRRRRNLRKVLGRMDWAHLGTLMKGLTSARAARVIRGIE